MMLIMIESLDEKELLITQRDIEKR